MSFSQVNISRSIDPEYWCTFLIRKNGMSTGRLKTCKFVNLQFSFFSKPDWPGRILMYSITLIMLSTARLFSFFEKKLLKSDIIFVSLVTALKSELYSLAIIKLLIFSWLCKFRSRFLSDIMLNYTREYSLAKLNILIDYSQLGD